MHKLSRTKVQKCLVLRASSTYPTPYSSPSSIHEKNGRNTRISHATLPRVKLSLKPRKLACQFQYSPVRSCRRDHAASASSTARNAVRTDSATARDATIVDSLLRTRQPPAETRWTPWNLEPSRKRTLYSLHLSP